MKRCPQCQQLFSDENFYCLSDGSALNSAVEPPEEITVFSPLPTIKQPVSNKQSGVHQLILYSAIALLVLIICGVLLLWVKLGSSVESTTKTEVSAVNSSSTPSVAESSQDILSERRSSLQNEQALLEKEKQKLADERRQFETQKTILGETLREQPRNHPTARIKFRRGSVEETVSGNIAAQRNFVLYTLSGQYLSASINSGNNCVTFAEGSTRSSFSTKRGDTYLLLVNNCDAATNFDLTVNVR